MKKNILIAIAFIGATSVFAQAPKKVKSPLDNRIFTLTLAPEGEKKAEPVKDECSFLPGGKFKSNFLLTAGFQQTDYEYEVDSTSGSPVYKFTVEAKNENQERFSWEGNINGDDLSGTAIIRKKGKIQHTYNLTGKWKNKKKPKPQPKAPVAPAAPKDSTTTTTITE
ncbi:MAG: hypothetical protein K0Q95_814 [Bacteroidota bacterium]|jgi:hypothetical protein|nr:hypothetical protein [Bacteroidota bacterium]